MRCLRVGTVNAIACAVGLGARLGGRMGGRTQRRSDTRVRRETSRRMSSMGVYLAVQTTAALSYDCSGHGDFSDGRGGASACAEGAHRSDSEIQTVCHVNALLDASCK